MGKLVLITGGVRSGKSRRALELAKQSGARVLFVASALSSDSEMAERIEHHRAERPGEWKTVEALSGKLAEALQPDGEDVLLLDCLGLYVARRIMEEASGKDIIKETLEAARAAADEFETSILVSNEVGSGLVPDNELGRLFIEALGATNSAVAALADQVELMVSGIPVKVK
jgi:adenosylcobinamide kinase / adenosylcobinamide-phosphate guanylyltransferase